MAKQTLPVDFQDDLLNVSMGEKRRYRMINNSDGTVSLEDVTVYDRIGSNFGAGQINATNQAVNESFDKNKLIRDLDTINALTEEGYAVDALSVKQITESLTNENSETFNFGVKDGVRGFFTNPSRADDSFIPFKSGGKLTELASVVKSTTEKTITVSDLSQCSYLIFCLSVTANNKEWRECIGTRFWTYDEFVNNGEITVTGIYSNGVGTTAKFTYVNDTTIKIKNDHELRSSYLLGVC